MNRQEILAKFRAQVAAGVPIIGGGAGTGITAKSAEAGGIDLLVIYNSGRFRMAGRGSLSGLLAYGDANAIVMDMANEVLPVVKHTPVLAGVNGTDPFRVMPHFLRQVKEIGFAGVEGAQVQSPGHEGDGPLQVELPPNQVTSVRVFVTAPPEAAGAGAQNAAFEIRRGDKTHTIDTAFAFGSQ